MNNFKNLSIGTLKRSHAQIFDKMIKVEHRINELKSLIPENYREKSERDWSIKCLMEASKGYHQVLKMIDDELQIRIWEGRVD